MIEMDIYLNQIISPIRDILYPFPWLPELANPPDDYYVAVGFIIFLSLISKALWSYLHLATTSTI